MKIQIARISLLQTAKVFAVLYFVITIPFILLMMLAMSFSPAPMRGIFSMGFMIFLPILYAVIGFIVTLIGAWVYNLIAKMIGGIEYTIVEV